MTAKVIKFPRKSHPKMYRVAVMTWVDRMAESPEQVEQMVQFIVSSAYADFPATSSAVLQIDELPVEEA